MKKIPNTAMAFLLIPQVVIAMASATPGISTSALQITQQLTLLDQLAEQINEIHEQYRLLKHMNAFDLYQRYHAVLGTFAELNNIFDSTTNLFDGIHTGGRTTMISQKHHQEFQQQYDQLFHETAHAIGEVLQLDLTLKEHRDRKNILLNRLLHTSQKEGLGAAIQQGHMLSTLMLQQLQELEFVLHRHQSVQKKMDQLQLEKEKRRNALVEAYYNRDHK